ncbi:phosphoribosyltransferase family protein [Pseudonocardia sp. 73-21]|uniref:phosphoribosyltransferase family protein n=1 Tax=Pseudonocardia sp. 73-21 TaxID=1895809 RepID=UPI000ACACF6C|nr:phosphoribosyltransferase family protein [Pseudonocardia sp. 73-21]
MTRTLGVADRLGVRVHGDAAALLGLALRRNPRRAQLLVSRVLGKHVPTDPRLVRAAGLLLGRLVADALADRPFRPLPTALLHRAIAGDRDAAAALPRGAVDDVDAMVLGFAETATALGHCVAEGLGGAPYLHSTRRPVPGVATFGGFTEEHSHATEHLLLPRDRALLTDARPLVLVDDELSTGRTVLNTITALHRVAPRERYVVAALVDVRTDDAHLVDGVAAMGARLDVVSLARGVVELPDDVVARAEAIRAQVDAARPDTPTRTHGEPDSRMVLPDPGCPAGGRHGFSPADHAALAAALPAMAAAVGVRPGERTLVLGTEELMALPLRLAQTLADGVDGRGGHDVAFSTTTRSPAVVVDEPGYALRSGITFPAHDDPADGPGPRFAYNVAPHSGSAAWDHVVVVVDPPADTPLLYSGLLAELRPHTRRLSVVVVGDGTPTDHTAPLPTPEHSA